MVFIQSFFYRKNLYKKFLFNISLKLLILFIFFYISIFFFTTLNISIKKDIDNIEKFYTICHYSFLLNKNTFKRFKNPKISLISTIYNKEKYLLRFITSIQNQIFTEIEIILIDDHSTDNSIKIIESLKNYDERIILLKHKKNKGTLIINFFS